MRIIAGKAKGHQLYMVPGDITRPVMDKVKESVFNIIAPYIVGSSFLDLFAGTGSVGIEALSWGAKFTRFIEIHRDAVKTIQANLEQTELASDAEVWHMDAFVFLERETDRQFDFVYVAPPQYKGLWIKALNVIDENPNWLCKDGWVIVQIDVVEEQEVELEHLKLFDRREYGSTKLLFYYLAPEENVAS